MDRRDQDAGAVMVAAPEPRIKHDASPSAELVAEAKKETVATDGRGRAIKLAKPNVLAQFRLVQLVGGQNAENSVYMRMVAPLTYVAAIDGVQVPSPTSMLELESLIGRLDEDGIAAVINKVNEVWGPSDTEADTAALKN